LSDMVLTPLVCRSHTKFMKVAVSIPDPIFREAERISRRIRLPRSQFYAHALEAYVRERSGEEITERLNEVYAKTSSKLDPAAEALSLEVLRREKW
jgi:metal-responsive CopG/Arc/MetJ family transcriptional regulator